MTMNISQLQGAGAAQLPQATTGASGYAGGSPQQKMSDLFSRIDVNNAGSISQSQFSSAFDTLNPPKAFQSAGKNAVWSALDPNGAGQVSKQDFISTMKNLMVQLRQQSPNASPAQTSLTDTSSVAQEATTSVNSFYI